MNTNETIYIIGIDDPSLGKGYVDKRVYAGNFTITNDLMMAREFRTLEEAKEYQAILNNLLKFEEHLTGRYEIFEYTKTVRPAPLNLGGDA